jgi:cation diffusion facilitator CzcD-associated flavoprotein CzcO
LAHRHVDNQVKDPVLREKLKPRDNFGCKRPLVLDDYYPVFNNKNVELITDPVTSLDENAIVSTNTKIGETERREIDVLIWGTGMPPNF